MISKAKHLCKKITSVSKGEKNPNLRVLIGKEIKMPGKVSIKL